MKLTNTSLIFSLLAAGLLCSGCGDDPPPDNTAKQCSPETQTGCAQGLACELVTGGKPACFEPVSVKGKVFDALNNQPIEGAHVVARDANDAAVSSVAITAADGSYALRVPAERSADGKVVDAKLTLRADAKAYAGFPKAPRVAIPFSLSEAAGKPLVVQTANTDIGLIPLPDASQFGIVSGKVIAPKPGGTLVVAGNATGIADLNGLYTVFNVPSGMVEVNGYAAGLNLDSKAVTVAAGQTVPNVDLIDNNKPTSRISGKISIVNASGGATTSIVLAVEETFVENAARGEVPKGLRVGNISGDWAIDGVPDGKYVVLAAFENDGLVRDPDTSIGGTQIVHIQVAGADQALSESFKVTGALAVISPGAEMIEKVSGAVTLSWEDDSSEDEYLVKLFDALGNDVWTKQGNFDPGGSKPVTLPYDGPALLPGMIYQFRATSIKGGVPISSTEDLKGVFQYQ